MESFGGKVRDEVLAVETFDSLLEAKTVIETLEKHLQHDPAALEPRLEDAGRLRGRLKDLRQPDSHSEWTDGWGPVT